MGVKKGIFSAEELLTLAGVENLPYTLYKLKDYALAGDAPRILAEHPDAAIAPIPLQHIMDYLSAFVLKMVARMHKVPGVSSKDTREMIITSLRNHVCSDCPIFVCILLPYKSVSTELQELDCIALVDGLKSFNPDELTQLGVSLDEYPLLAEGAKVLSAALTNPDASNLSEGEAWIPILPTGLARKLKKSALIPFAKAHGIKVSQRWTLPTIQEQFNLHSCGEGCPTIFCQFAPLEDLNVLEEDPDDDPRSLDWPRDDNDREKKKWPPKPLSLKERASIVRDFIADCDPDLLKEGHCAVCAQIFLQSELAPFDKSSVSLVPLIEDNVAVYDRLSREEPKRYVHGPILDPNSQRICENCLDCLSRGQRPKLALANGLWLGEVPECLKCLTYAEKLLIAKIRHNRSVVRVSTGHAKMVANVVSYPNPTPKVYKKLPPHRRELDDVLVFIFVGVQPPTESDFKRTPMMVRRLRVLEALEWLCVNHEDYWDVAIDHEALESYSESKAPVEVLFHPLKDGEGNLIPTAVSVNETDLEHGTSEGPCPFRVHGLSGTGYEAMTVPQRTIHAIRYLNRGGNALAIGHDEEMESIYKNPALYPQMFPWLFPRGKGGIGQEDNKGLISETIHKRWLLNYYDKRFQEDAHFVVVAFNHDQIKEGSSKSFVMTRRRNFASIARRIRDLNPAALRDIAMRMEEGQNVKPETDEERRCFALLDAIKNVSVNVCGSLASKQNQRSSLWSMTYFLGLPPWYITIAPVDHKHPICIVKCGGQTIFEGDIIPPSVRVNLASTNPVGCAKFFDFVVRLFIKHVIGWKKPGGGRYGNSNGFFSMVEQQGRLSLHLHAVVYIEGTLTPQQIRDRLLGGDSEFQKDLLAYLEGAHIGEFMTGTMEQVEQSLNEYQDQHPDYEDPTLTLPTSPPDVRCPNEGPCECGECKELEQWNERFKLEVDDLIFRSNIHDCKPKKTGGGEQKSTTVHIKGCQTKEGKCSSRFPRPVFPESSVDQKDGHINLKKLEPMINTVTPELTFLLRCNTDVSSLLSGTAMKAVIGYVTDYITKPTLKTYQVFSTSYDVFERYDALLSPELRGEDELKAARVLIMKVVNSLTSQMEIGAPMAALYLLGNPDCYCSHEFVPFYWKGFMNYVWSTWEDFERAIDPGEQHDHELNRNAENLAHTDGSALIPDELEEESDTEEEDNSIGNEVVTIRRTSGSYVGKSTLDDYRYRPKKYENISLYEWIQCAVRRGRGTGRGKNNNKLKYYRYLEGHSLRDSHLVTADPDRRHTVIPNFLGPMLPRKDEGDPNEYSCAMLTIFKPWRSPIDLKEPGASWKETFDNHAFTAREKRLIANLNLRYECYDAKEDYAAQMASLPGNVGEMSEANDVDFDGGDNDDMYGVDEVAAKNAQEGDDDDPARVSESVIQARQMLENAGWSLESDGEVKEGDASHDPTERLQVGRMLTAEGWKRLVSKARKQVIDSKYGGPQFGTSHRDVHGQSTEMESSWHSIRKAAKVFVMKGSWLTKDFGMFNQKAISDNSTLLKDLKSGYMFNYEQQKAFDIVTNHAMATNPEQLKMYIGGMGGTGKSRVLKGIIEFFKGRGEEYRIVVLAPTGNAASLIDGSTYHSYLKIYPGERERDVPARVDMLRTQMVGVDYIFIDEVSMMSCYDMYRVSKRLCDARNKPDLPFGGVNVIFAGDFAQLPPTSGFSLYTRKVSEYQSPRQSLSEQNTSIGKRAWLQVTTVVMLKKNMRQTSDGPEDIKFRKALENLRYFNCDDEDIAFLRSRVPANNKTINMNSPGFRFAAVITSLNEDRDGFNELYIRRFAREKRRKLKFFFSIDKPAADPLARTTKKRKVTKIRLRWLDRAKQEKLWRMPSSTSKLIPGKLALCVGMPVCIRYNIATELCITKGQEGTVAGWISRAHPRWPEKQCLDVLFVKLTNPPKKIQLDYLPENVVPITRNSTALRAAWGTKKRQVTPINRTQIPVVPFFAMTDYASQGKSREYNVVDLAMCRSFQAIYVCLSRGTTADGTVILDDFEDHRFRGVLDKDLAMEYRALKHLDEMTDLVYRGELPNGILHTNRTESLKAYKDWKGIRENEEGLEFDGTTSRKRKGSDQTVETSSKRVKTTRMEKSHVAVSQSGFDQLSQSVGAMGCKWDRLDPSCAYDCVITLMFNLWRCDPRWRTWLDQMPNGILADIAQMFGESERMTGHGLNNARNCLRTYAREVDPSEFGRERGYPDIGHLIRVMLGWLSLQRPLALSCDNCREVYPSGLFEALDVYTFLYANKSSSDALLAKELHDKICPHGHNDAYLLSTYTPWLWTMLDPDVPMKISITHTCIDGETQYRLAGVIYLGGNHFTSRVIHPDGHVYYHDSMAPSQVAEEEGTVESGDWDVKLRSARGRQACVLLYVMTSEPPEID